MARNHIRVDLPPEAVFEVLADPRFLANWVVGASRTRWLEGDWPAVGSTIAHSQIMVIHDTTTVVASDPPRRLQLEARARPLAVANVEVTLEPVAGGTEIVIDEHVIGGLASALPAGLNDVLIRLRNRESARRLRWLSEIGEHLRTSRAESGSGITVRALGSRHRPV
jgi:uncharacterized protein YndB with AHSA1/START domain